MTGRKTGQDEEEDQEVGRARGPAARGRQENQQQKDDKRTSSKRTTIGLAARGRQEESLVVDDMDQKRQVLSCLSRWCHKRSF